MSIKTLKRIFGLFTGSLLGKPQLAPRVTQELKNIPHTLPVHARRVIRSKFKQQKRAARIRQKLARRVMREHIK